MTGKTEICFFGRFCVEHRLSFGVAKVEYNNEQNRKSGREYYDLGDFREKSEVFREKLPEKM